jgi:hypothetical protein
VAGERHGMCESGLNTAGERHGMCESALKVCTGLYKDNLAYVTAVTQLVMFVPEKDKIAWNSR